MTAPHHLPLPSNFREAVRLEFRRAFQHPYDTPLVVAINAVLMSSCWFFLPPGLKDNVFTFHGALDYSAVLCAWMYSDVPTTNVLGADAARISRALGDPTMLRRMLTAKCALLWLLITPFCLCVAAYSLLSQHRPMALLFSAIWIAIVPLGFLGIAGWLGIRFPYHPMPVRYRLDHLHPPLRMLWRWLALLLLPYAIVPAVALALMVPSLLIWGIASTQGLTSTLPQHSQALGIGVACVAALCCAVMSLRVSVALIKKRAPELQEILEAPTWG